MKRILLRMLESRKINSKDRGGLRCVLSDHTKAKSGAELVQRTLWST